jgi:class 3 adenylate cyclase
MANAPDSSNQPTSASLPSNPGCLPHCLVEDLDGQVPLASPFYVDRPPIETDCYGAIVKSAGLIRIKAPRQMGKSSLLTRILDRGKSQGYRSVYLNFQLADADAFQNLDCFLQWFCGSIAQELGLEDRLDELWRGVLGSKNKCTRYVQRHLLELDERPLVIGIDEVDRLFEYRDVAADFFGLLRAWHERGKNEPTWQPLRLAIAHSQEVYIPLNINQSPFNVGLPIELPEFSLEQVRDLSQRYQLTLSSVDLERLMQLLGGHPYLTRVALAELARDRLTLVDLWKDAATDAGLYRHHLRRHSEILHSTPELLESFKSVVFANQPIDLPSSDAFKLRSLGLVKLLGNDVEPLCDLYRQYFQKRLLTKRPNPLDLKRESALAAIVFTDVVNSTEIMSRDQLKAIDAIERDLQLMQAICRQGNGRVLKEMGDGLLMYFTSAVEAVRCSCKIQQAFAKRAKDSPKSQYLEHRIGIHLGDVFLCADDVLGTGVNVAARLQSQASPGRICISETVYSVVIQHMELTVRNLGPKELKGIIEPMFLYEVMP